MCSQAFHSQENSNFYWESFETNSIPILYLYSNSSKKIPIADRSAFFNLKKMADQSCGDAQLQIGLCYILGRGVEKSYQSALYYFKLAADQGMREAQNQIATLYENGQGITQSYHKALHYYKLAAHQGSAWAQVRLGYLYANGKGVKKSSKKAMKYYEMALKQDNPLTWVCLAQAYESGEGLEKSVKTANYFYKKRFQLYEIQAEEGDVDALTEIGKCFENGEGVEKCHKKAFYYYQLSANQNFVRGLVHLAHCYADGIGITKSIEKAIYYYKIAANQGCAIAQYCLARYLILNKVEEELAVDYLKVVILGQQVNQGIKSSCQYHLAQCFEMGIGINKSSKNAIYYYKLSAENGNSIAQNKLGDIYLDGLLDIKKCSKKAIYYYNLAASQDHIGALMNLSWCYENGSGVERSRSKAFYYQKLAAEISIPLGVSCAVFQLARCYELAIGTSQSLTLAIYYYKLSAEDGHPEGYARAGRCCLKIGGEEAEKQASIYFKLRDNLNS